MKTVVNVIEKLWAVINFRLNAALIGQFQSRDHILPIKTMQLNID